MPRSRPPLSRDRVLSAAVTYADEHGLDALSMRGLADLLGVVPMALYKHVANKDALLDGMVDVIVGEIDPPQATADWRPAVRARILSARAALVRHPWAADLFRTRTSASPVVLGYMDSLMGMFRAGGFSDALTHHVMHALSTRMWGLTLDVFPTPPPPPDEVTARAMMTELATRYPNILAIASAAGHDPDGRAVGGGCDDQAEFEFALDVLLDGFARRLAAQQVR